MENKKFIEDINKIFRKGAELIAKKNLDYGEDHDPFKNFNLSKMIGVQPEKAILVRMTDKISRISTLLDKKADVKDEKIEDTIIDLMNYAAILLVYIKNNN